MEGMIELENRHAVTPNEIIDSYKDHVSLKCIKCVFTTRKWEHVAVNEVTRCSLH